MNFNKENQKKTKREKIISIEKARNRLIYKTLKFTEIIVVWGTLLYVLNWLVSIALIVFAIIKTGNFSYLDELIKETGETYRALVVSAIIKFGVENIFKYNDFGGRVPTKEPPSDDI